MKTLRLSIRTRLLLWFSLAGLLPLFAMSAFGLYSITRRLQETIHEDTLRSLRIGMNLLLRQAQQTAADVTRLANAADIQAMFRKYKELAKLPDPRPQNIGDINKLMERYRGEVSSGLVELCDTEGRVFARYSFGSPHMEETLATQDNATIIKKGLNYEHDINFVRGSDYVVIRAISPVMSSRFELLGAIILSLPLDHYMAKSLLATLRVDVAFYMATDDNRFKPTASSLVKPDGDQYPGFKLPARVYEETRAKRSNITVAEAMNRSFSVGIIPLLDSDKSDEDSPEIGFLAVAVDRRPLIQSRNDGIKAMFVISFFGIAVALLLGFIAAKSLSAPLRKLHSGAIAVARGDLELKIDTASGDEIGELAEAFNFMTASLKENQERLAARISEIITLHTIGRAVGSVMGLDEVLKTVVEEIRNALGTDITALFLSDDEGKLWLNATAGLTEDVLDDWESGGDAPLARPALQMDEPFCIESIEAGPEESIHIEDKQAIDDGCSEEDYSEQKVAEQKIREIGRSLGITGSVMLVPLAQKEQCIGVMLLVRKPPASPFRVEELRLLSTLAGQAGTAIENARLYEEVTAFNERLEQMVEERTAELRQANKELADTLHDLQETQSQLLLSERLAGLGSLVAGIAHEVNTPAAAIQGAAANLVRNINNIASLAFKTTSLSIGKAAWKDFLELINNKISSPPENEIVPSLEAKKRSENLERELAGYGFENAALYAHRMTDLGAGDDIIEVVRIGGPDNAEALTAILLETVLLKRNTSAVDAAIRTINRIVTALRAYSHLDQTHIERVNIHDGIETTLVILNNLLKYDVEVTRHYGDLPSVPVYVDELNQVWTNLIVNAVDAVSQQEELDKKVVIKTEQCGSEVVVRIIDTGPGIPKDNLTKIFKPFFTTKAKGQGTGLGLGIVQRIVEKHGGKITAESKPGKTCFSVYLPVSGPPAQKDPAPDRRGNEFISGEG